MKELLRIKYSIVVKWSVSPSPLPRHFHIPSPYLCLHFSEPLSGFTFTRPWLAGCLSIFNCLPNSLSVCTYVPVHLHLPAHFHFCQLAYLHHLFDLLYLPASLFMYQLIYKPSRLSARLLSVYILPYPPPHRQALICLSS